MTAHALHRRELVEQYAPTAGPTYAPSSAPTATPSYAPSAGPSSYAPSAAPSRPPTLSFRLEARKCYDNVRLRDFAAEDLYCDQHDPADCLDLFVPDCVAYCEGKEQIMNLVSDHRGGLIDCFCATARRSTCLRVAGYGSPVDVADLDERNFDGICVLADDDVWLSDACKEHHEEEQPYEPTYRPTAAPTAEGGVAARAAVAAPAESRTPVGFAALASVLLGAAVLCLVALLVCRWRERRRHQHIAESMDSSADFVPLGDARRVELVSRGGFA